jgi:hypothetical protein
MLKETLLLAATRCYLQASPSLASLPVPRRKVSSLVHSLNGFFRFSINNKSIGEIITDFRLRVVNCDNFGDGDTIVELILSARHQFVVTICKGKDAHRHSP